MALAKRCDIGPLADAGKNSIELVQGNFRICGFLLATSIAPIPVATTWSAHSASDEADPGL
jgi:hypothetical protein